MHTQCKFASKFTFFRESVARLDKIAINTLSVKTRKGEPVDSTIAHVISIYEYAMRKKNDRYFLDTFSGLPDLTEQIKDILSRNLCEPYLFKTELAELIASVSPLPIDIIKLCGDAAEEMAQYEHFINKVTNYINIQLRLVEGKNYVVEIADITFPPDKKEISLKKIFQTACDTGVVEGVVKVYEDASALQRVTTFGIKLSYRFREACQNEHAVITQFLWEIASHEQKNELLTDIENRNFVSACERGRVDVVQFLWEIISESQRTKLMDERDGKIILDACSNGWIRLVKFFWQVLSAEQKTNLIKVHKLDFYWACNHYYAHIADFFWQLTIAEEKDKIHEQWYSIFESVCKHTHSSVDMVKFLWGIRKDAKTSFLSAVEANTLFPMTCQSSSGAKVQFIWQLIADEQKCLLMNKMGTELFHNACLSDNIEVAQFLLSKALPEQRSQMLFIQNSLIFRQVCKARGLIRIVKFLWNQTTDSERSSMWEANDHEAFCQACQAGNEDNIKFLWEMATESQKRAVLLGHSLANFKLLTEQDYPHPSFEQSRCLRFIWRTLLVNEQDQFKTRSAFSELCEQRPETVHSQLECHNEIELLFMRMLLAYEIDRPQLCVWLNEIADIIMFRIQSVDHKLHIFNWLLQHESFQKKMTELELITHSAMEPWLDVISRIRQHVIVMIFKEAESKIFREDKQQYLITRRRHKLFDISTENWQQRANDRAIVENLDTSIERFIKLSSQGNSPSRLTATEEFRRFVDGEITLATF